MPITRGKALIAIITTAVLILLFLGIIHRDKMINTMTETIQENMKYQVTETISMNPGPGSKKHPITLVDIHTPSTDQGECMDTKTNPVYKICIYDPKIDKIVSAYLKKDGKWEGAYLPTFQSILKSDPELGFLDIGANIGPWGLLAAAMGHKTIMVEPFPNHTEKIKHSVQVGNVQNNTIIVQNSISDQYSVYSPSFPYGKSNLGALRMVPYKGTGPKMASVHMNDLVPILPFNRALMKLDLEGFEDKGLVHSDELFKAIFIPYVLMEWAFPKYVYKDDSKRVMALINSMTSKGYKPYEYGWKPLSISTWSTWPLDIIWRHNLFTPVL